MNQYESAAIADQFAVLGYTLTHNWDADVFIINTCTVTNKTDYKSRNQIRKALKIKQMRPDTKVFVTGCYYQRSFEALRQMNGIDLIIDNQFKTDISKWLDATDYSFLDIMQANSFHYIPVNRMLDRSRAFQKIQDGCDFYCSYCAVPYARGHSRSCKFEDVTSQANIFAQNGYSEIVLGGVNLGLYRDGDRSLIDVVKALEDIENLRFIRLSSIEPQLFTKNMIKEFSQIGKICPHFHIPLQSGSDSVLKRMGRRYDTALVSDLIHTIRDFMPDAAIGMDVICAFPDESNDEAGQTLAFINSLPISYLHVFTYSPREGTAAAKLKNRINGSIAQARADDLMALSDSKKIAYMQYLIDHQVVLSGVIESSDDHIATALSDHYIRIYDTNTINNRGIMSLVPNAKHQDGLTFSK